MANKSLINVSKHEDKLRKIIKLNEIGSTIYTDKSSEALSFGCSKSEFIEALKKDIDKTAKDLIDSKDILLSINNGLVMDINSLDNNVENFFGKTYNKIGNKVTLSGVRFFLNEKTFPTKTEIINSIYLNVLNTNKKDLKNLSNALALYETSNEQIKKAVLYPSILLADELIERIGHISTKFNNYRNTMEFDEKLSFDTTFKRSGITEVIQNSTYINKDGILQCVHTQKSAARKIASKLMNNEFKYIEAVEIDGDGDCDKALKLIKQIERLKINSSHKFTLKFRKLGNLNARGVFFQSGLIVAEDVRDTSALLHEIAHFIHLTNTYIYNNDFVNHMISKLGNRINFKNLDVTDLEREAISKKDAYYTDPKEVIARGLEIASLLAFEKGMFIQSTEEFDLIKSRDFYSKYEGIYFDFLSFDEETKSEMLELYKLFYETSYDEVLSTNINNFIKIDTRFSKIKKEKDAFSILKEERKREEKEKKALFALVTSSNLDLIIKNKGSLTMKELALIIMANISYCGGHNKSMNVTNWSYVCNEKAYIVLILLEKLKEELTIKENITFLYQLKINKVIEGIKSHALAEGFNTKASLAIKRLIRENIEDSYFYKLREIISLINRTPLNLADKQILNDKEFITGVIDLHPLVIQRLEEFKEIEKETLIEYFLYFLENFNNKSIFMSSTSLMLDARIMKKYLLSIESINSLSRFSGNTFDTEKLVDVLLEKFPDSQVYIFERIGDNLKNNYDFMSKHVLLNKDLKKFIGDEIKHLFIEKEIQENFPTCQTKEDSVIQKIDIVESNEEESTTQEADNYPDFNDLIKSAEIVDFTHTGTGELLKVFRIKEKISDFKAFNKYVIKSGIGYYSRIANGFIIKNIEKVATVTGATLYSQELMDVFSSGRLF